MAMRAAYQRQRKEYGPGGWLQAQGGRVAELAAELWATKEAAYAVLKNRVQRKEIRTTLIQPVQLRYSAELLFNQARTAEFRTDWETAREAYEMANELHPEDRFLHAIQTLDRLESSWRKRLREKELEGLA